MRRRRHTTASRARRIASLVAVMVTVTAGVALAWTSDTTNTANSVSALTVASPTGLTAVKVGGTANRCDGIDVSWTAAAAPADTYRVDVKSGLGSWTTLTSDTGGAITYNDPASYINVEVSYRVYTRIDDAFGALSQWLSTPAEFSLLCNQVGDVTDLDGAFVGCSVQLTWTAATNADMYDIQRSINGGANWSNLANNHGDASTESYDVTAALSGTVQFRIRPIAGGSNGEWSNVAEVAGLGFYVTDIAITGNGDDVLDVGETIAVTFNRAADDATPAGATSQSIYIKRGGGRGIYISNDDGALGATAIARITAAGNFVTAGNQGAVAGAGAWDGTDTTWTWTSSASVPFNATPSWSAYAVGTSGADPDPVACSDGSTLLADSTPNITGAF